MTVDTDTPWFIRSSTGRTDSDLDRLFINDVIALGYTVNGFKRHADELKHDAKGVTIAELQELTVDAEELLEDMGFVVVDDEHGYVIYREA